MINFKQKIKLIKIISAVIFSVGCWQEKTSLIQAIGQTQYLYLFNNQIKYDDWAENLAERTTYSWLIKRENKTYHNQASFSHNDFVDETVWQGNEEVYLRPVTTDRPIAFIALDDNLDNYGIVEHQLEEEELDFAYLSFKYKMSNFRPQDANYPALRLDLCGQTDYLVLEKSEPKTESVMSKINDLTSNWAEVVLPNPGTCDLENRKLKLSLTSTRRNKPFALRFFDFAFNQIKIRVDDEVNLQATAETKIALIAGEEILEKGEKIGLARDDWAKNNLAVGTLKNGEVVATEKLANFLLAENLPEINLEINNLVFEEDLSLSGRATFSSQEKLKEIEIGVTEEIDQLTGSWEKVAKIKNDYQTEFKTTHYVSVINGWQTFHLPEAINLDQEKGFFIAARATNWEKQFSQLSNIYFCQNLSCEEVTTPEKDFLQMQKIFFSTETQNGYLELINSGTETIALENYFLTNQEASELPLTGSLLPGEARKVFWSKENNFLTRENGKIFLYQKNETEDNQLKEEFTYTNLEQPLSWWKNTNTNDWKKVYDRE